MLNDHAGTSGRLALFSSSPWLEISAALFGVGAGLTIDEFALWVHLESRSAGDDIDVDIEVDAERARASRAAPEGRLPCCVVRRFAPLCRALVASRSYPAGMRGRSGLGVVAALVALAGCGGSSGKAQGPARDPRGASSGSVAHAPGGRHDSSSSREQAAVARLRALGLPVYCGARRGRLVALTFDDGPGPYTHFAMKELRQAHASATFFLVARSIQRFPDWPRRELSLAALGDHTATHPDLLLLPPAGVTREIALGRDAVRRAAGPPVVLFRPPYGARSPRIDQEVRRQGMLDVLWSIDSGDSNTLRPQNYAAISRTVRQSIQPGSIVLFHDNRGQTIRALRSILPALARRHLQPVTVPRLLAQDPPSERQLRRGLSGCLPGSRSGRTSVSGTGG